MARSSLSVSEMSLMFFSFIPDAGLFLPSRPSSLIREFFARRSDVPMALPSLSFSYSHCPRKDE